MFPHRAFSNWSILNATIRVRFTLRSSLVLSGSSFCSVHSSFSRIDCTGCGCKLQSVADTDGGYIPEKVLSTFNNGWKRSTIVPRGTDTFTVPEGVEVSKADTVRCYLKASKPYCQRCFVLQQYRRDPLMNELGLTYSTSVSTTVEDVCSSLGSDSIVLNVIDITNFESSVLPELLQVLSRRRIPVIHVLNKMDCLPMNMYEWKSVADWAVKLSKDFRSHMGVDAKSNLVPVSSVSEENFELLESRLGQFLTSGVPRDIHVVGRENSGKSTFVNRFLHFIKHKHSGTVHHKRAVGGITRSPFRGTTVRPIEISLGHGMRLIDTPGISAQDNISKYFTCAEDYRDMFSGEKFQPLSHNIKTGKCLLLGGMARVEVVSGLSAIFTCFVPPRVTMHICDSQKADDVLRRKVGTFLYPPHVSDFSKHCETHPIIEHAWVKHRVSVFCGPSKVHDEIVIPGVGWLGISGHGHKEIDVYVPQDVQVFRRPAMMTKYLQKTGVSKFSFRQRGRTLTVNKKKKAIVQSLRNESKMRTLQAVFSNTEPTALKQSCDVLVGENIMPLDHIVPCTIME